MSFYKILIILVLFSTASLSKNIDDFTIMSEEYPPFNMTINNKPSGVSVEVLEGLLKKVDSDLTKNDIKFLPWARSYSLVQRQKHTMLFSMARTKQREKLFKWVGPVGSSIVALIARKDKNIKINSVEDMKKYKIGSVKNDVAELALKELGITHMDSISGTNAIEKSIKKLDRGRIDIFAYMYEIKSWKIDNFNPKNYENVYTLKRNDFYYAFHKDTDDVIIQKMQKALDDLKNDGTFNLIQSKYGR